MVTFKTKRKKICFIVKPLFKDDVYLKQSTLLLYSEKDKTMNDISIKVKNIQIVNKFDDIFFPTKILLMVFFRRYAY